MSEIVERVAKAKWARRQEVARKAGIHPPLADWDDELEALREEVRAETRAAIAAMREPTEGMRCAGVCAVQNADDGAGEPWDYVDETWQAMIDEASKEQ